MAIPSHRSHRRDARPAPTSRGGGRWFQVSNKPPSWWPAAAIERSRADQKLIADLVEKLTPFLDEPPRGKGRPQGQTRSQQVVEITRDALKHHHPNMTNAEIAHWIKENIPGFHSDGAVLRRLNPRKPRGAA